MIQASDFDLSGAVKCISEHHFERVVCQFPDEYLSCCTDVYLTLTEQVPPECDVFIAADSTFGSSVDDISAAHVEADLLIFFGSDLSGSGSVNVMIIPPRKRIDIPKCTDSLLSAILAIDSTQKNDERSDEEERTELPPTLLIFDPCYLHARESLLVSLKSAYSSRFPGLDIDLIDGQLPGCFGEAGHWQPTAAQCPVVVNGSPTEQVGGVYFAAHDILRALIVLYIGEKEEQLSSLFLRLSQHQILRYSPEAETNMLSEEKGEELRSIVEVFHGGDTRVFRERYGGVSKVKAAKIIGLLVGSMGIETENLQTIVSQLQKLIEAAGKKYYVFVLGRINEAKLCNFPEIDLFCLISNDDTAIIPPKSFHVPVITPFELELGLGARVWSSRYLTSCTASYIPAAPGHTTSSASSTAVSTDADELQDVSMLELFDTRLQRVLEARANRSDGSDSDSDSEGGVDESYVMYAKTFKQSAGEDVSQALSLLSVKRDDSSIGSAESSNKLIAFESPAAAYLAGREFQGLTATTEEGTSTKIMQGQFGIAAEYER